MALSIAARIGATARRHAGVASFADRQPYTGLTDPGEVPLQHHPAE